MFAELYVDAFHIRRSLLGIPFSTPGMLATDGFTGNSSWKQGEDVRRARVLECMNCSTAPIPPRGWSGHGSPCDGIHAHVRASTDALEAIAVGEHSNIFVREDESKMLECSRDWVQKISPKVLLGIDVLGYSMVAEMKPLMQHVVVSRRFVTPAELESWGSAMSLDVVGPDAAPHSQLVYVG